MNLLFENGQLLDGRIVSVTVDDGRISSIGAGHQQAWTGRERVDCAGRLLLPGAIDNHVHMRQPGPVHKEGWARGSRCALKGGVTRLFDIQNAEPYCDSAGAVARKAEIVGGLSRVRFSLYGSVTRESIPHIGELAGAVPAVKLFMGGSTGADGIEAFDDLIRVFRGAAEVGLPLVLHCEENLVNRARAATAGQGGAYDHNRARPPASEDLSVRTAIALCRTYRTPIHIFHISTAGALLSVRRAKEAGLPVTCSACFHYLLFTADDVSRRGGWLKVNPPIRPAGHREALIAALRDGLIDALSTDHAPHPLAEKAQPAERAPSGVPSLELFLPLLFTLAARYGLAPAWLHRLVSDRVADLYGIADEGRIAPGMRADLVLFDPSDTTRVERETVLSGAGWSPWEGVELSGRVVGTWVGGERRYPFGE